MNIEQARYNMVEQQIRPWEVLDQTVLDLFLQVPREDYVPLPYRGLAFADMEIPLGHGESMLAPKLEARLLQEAGVQPADRVLEIGTGSGFMTALLAGLARHVYSVDIIAEFTESARRKLGAHEVVNVTLETGDAAQGWSTHAPYDVIVLTGSVPYLPESFEQALAPGGRLIAVIGDPPVMHACRVRRVGAGAYARESLFETCIKALRNAPQPARFVL